MPSKPIQADVAIGRVTVEPENEGDEPTEMQVGVPCLIHEEAGIVWSSDPIPLGPFGLQLASGMLKHLQNTMMEADKDWNRVARSVDWTIVGELGGGNRKQRRAKLTDDDMPVFGQDRGAR